MPSLASCGSIVAEDAHAVAVPAADKPEAVMFALIDPLRASRDRVARGRQAGLCKAGRAADEARIVPVHASFVAASRSARESGGVFIANRFWSAWPAALSSSAAHPRSDGTHHSGSGRLGRAPPSSRMLPRSIAGPGGCLVNR
jgi:hypothetical protein